jgi:hypothetical protein
VKAKDYAELLKLQPHPEGGYFGEFYRSELEVSPEDFIGPRNACTSIYFLLEEGQFSALHKIKSDEIWHFYEGDSLEILEITEEGKFRNTALGRNLKNGEVLSYVVKAGHWFGSRTRSGGKFSLVGCTVSPGFDFRDFEMPDQNWFLEHFPFFEKEIREITR